MSRAVDLVAALKDAVGPRHVLMTARQTLRYRRGFRAEAGSALAVVRPGSLVEYWRVLERCVAAGVAVIVQAANTGLTGGSTPDAALDRPVVIINTMRIDGFHPIDGGAQVVCLPGVTLNHLEGELRRIGREPHSLIGSSCFGASVVGGVCNNSGGSLVRRGPSYTELALFAQVDADGRLRLVNQLGIDLGNEPEAMLTRLQSGDFGKVEAGGAASDIDYCEHVRDIAADTPARFNADPRRLNGASGSAGRIAVFAVRLDTFVQSRRTATFYIGTNDSGEFTRLRHALLSGGAPLPVSAEYLHRETFDIAERYGRDTFHAIRLLGTARLPKLFAIKSRLDFLGERIGIPNISEHVLQGLSRLMPSQITPRLRAWRERFEHHLILKVDDDAIASTRALLERSFPSANGDMFECTADEAARAGLHRFVAAGAAVRIAAVRRKEVGGVLALDVALRRNATAWFGEVPDDLNGQIVGTLRYGHFLCHVFHRDYLLAPGADPVAVKRRLLEQLDAAGAEYPAEHNVGRQYAAKPALADFYRALDPTNRFNPGIGRTPVGENWSEAGA